MSRAELIGSLARSHPRRSQTTAGHECTRSRRPPRPRTQVCQQLRRHCYRRDLRQMCPWGHGQWARKSRFDQQTRSLALCNYYLHLPPAVLVDSRQEQLAKFTSALPGQLEGGLVLQQRR